MRSLDRGGPHIINKSRQIGISTTVMLWVLWFVCEHPGVTVVVVSRREDTAKDLLEIAKVGHEMAGGGLPEMEPSALVLKFANGSRIRAESCSEHAGRSFAAEIVVGDEFAYQQYQKEMVATLQPTLGASLTGRFIVISNPNGEGNEFHRLWLESKRDGSDWSRFELPWQCFPPYDQAWYDRERPKYTVAQWEQEFECKFTSAGGTVIDPSYIDAAIGGEASGPVEGHAYQIGVDVSGDGQDLTIAVVLDVTESPWQVVQVSVWEVLPTQDMQREIDNLGSQYGCAPYVDATGLGWAVWGNLKVPSVGVVFTAGNAEPSYNEELMRWTCPRNKLIANFVKTFEDGLCKVPAEFESLIDACRGLRWSKKESNLPDYSDALMLALFAAGPAAPDWWIR